jgi:hypothetical protein
MGLDPDVAVLTQERGDEAGAYVRSMRQRERPAKLREARRLARCRVPASSHPVFGPGAD